MAIRGPVWPLHDDTLLHGAPDLAPEAWFDAHTHIGHNDPDGMEADVEDLLEGLDAAGHARALVFPMHEPGGYPPANDVVRDAVARHPDRLRWLCRVDPNADGAVAELERCLADGAGGLKLHPRSDAFGIPHPVVDELAAVCAAHRRPMLFHAGRGIPNLGSGALELARRHPEVPIILAHAGISDLGLLTAPDAQLPNLYFDTSWWQVADVLTLLAHIPPARILYASDMPYGPGTFAQFLLVRCARQLGIGDDALAVMAGAQLARLLDGEAPLDAGPPPGPEAVGRRALSAERAVAHASAAVYSTFRGGDAGEAISLARLGCQHGPADPDAELLTTCDLLLARAQDLVEEHDDGFAAVPGLLMAQAIAGTPDVPPPPVT